MTINSTQKKRNATNILRQAGIINPWRLVKLVNESIAFIELDLTGLTILTEAASGPYVVTPVIAALAGADRVLALTKKSEHASIEEVTSQTRALEVLCNLDRSIEIFSNRTIDLFASADIITNLGFVRPINSEAIAAMKETAVIPLMCESWERREGDVDINACFKKKLPVLGTNEDSTGLDIFKYSGWLCLKLILSAQIEIHKNHILIVSRDKFGETIKNLLLKLDADVHLVSSLRDIKDINKYDVLVVADYTREDYIIGPDGDIEVNYLTANAPSISIVQLCGRTDVDQLIAKGIAVYPGIDIESHRMVKTLSELGLKPVIELHTAGLKVGQAMASARLKGMSFTESIKYALANSPAQAIKDKLTNEAK
jgi:hypothetical protein